MKSVFSGRVKQFTGNKHNLLWKPWPEQSKKKQQLNTERET